MENEGAKIPVAILVRVSTVKQETARQISELQTYADAKGYEVIEVCRETISGQADEHERHGLIRAEELARSGKVQKILVHEISRLARKNSVAHRFVESLEECKVSLYGTRKQSKPSWIMAGGIQRPGIMLALLAEIARNEAETLRERIQSGLAEARRKGIKLGRPIGTKLSRENFLQRHRDILRQLKAGQSVRNAAKITGKGVSTVQRVKALA